MSTRRPTTCSGKGSPAVNIRDDGAGIRHVYKILPRADWEHACRHGTYAGSPDDLRDGFIHLSAADQVAATAARHFRGIRDLVLVALDRDALGEALRWEPSRGGALFPHYYGPLPVSAARWWQPLELAADGVPIIPAEIEAC